MCDSPLKIAKFKYNWGRIELTDTHSTTHITQATGKPHHSAFLLLYQTQSTLYNLPQSHEHFFFYIYATISISNFNMEKLEQPETESPSSWATATRDGGEWSEGSLMWTDRRWAVSDEGGECANNMRCLWSMWGQPRCEQQGIVKVSTTAECLVCIHFLKSIFFVKKQRTLFESDYDIETEIHSGC